MVGSSKKVISKTSIVPQPLVSDHASALTALRADTYGKAHVTPTVPSESVSSTVTSTSKPPCHLIVDCAAGGLASGAGDRSDELRALYRWQAVGPPLKLTLHRPVCATFVRKPGASTRMSKGRPSRISAAATTKFIIGAISACSASGSCLTSKLCR